MRYTRSIAAVSYVVLSVLSADQQFFFANGMALVVCLGLVPFALGAFTRRWWMLCLPFVTLLVAIPFGLPNAAEGEAPLPTWFDLLFVLPLQLALIALGVGGRKLWERCRRSPKLA